MYKVEQIYQIFKCLTYIRLLIIKEENEKYSNIYIHCNCYHCMQCSYKIVIYFQQME